MLKVNYKLFDIKQYSGSIEKEKINQDDGARNLCIKKQQSSEHFMGFKLQHFNQIKV